MGLIGSGKVKAFGGKLLNLAGTVGSNFGIPMSGIVGKLGQALGKKGQDQMESRAAGGGGGSEVGGPRPGASTGSGAGAGSGAAPTTGGNWFTRWWNPLTTGVKVAVVGGTVAVVSLITWGIVRLVKGKKKGGRV